MTGVYRSNLDGGGIGSGFGSIPYSNTASAQLSETRFSVQNSRIGLKADSVIGDWKVLGYYETDFLGNAPTNINVASNSDTLRLRVYFVDLRDGPLEFLAGQSWSLMTPNRKGLSPLPGDIFYTQDMDTNYQVGLIWGRTPGLRATTTQPMNGRSAWPRRIPTNMSAARSCCRPTSPRLRLTRAPTER